MDGSVNVSLTDAPTRPGLTSRHFWTSTPESQEDYQEFLGSNVQIGDCDPDLWQVAWAEEEVVGFVITRIRAGIATVPEVAVRRAWQRRGIARSLMLAALRSLHQRGITHMRLFTDAEMASALAVFTKRWASRQSNSTFFIASLSCQAPESNQESSLERSAASIRREQP